MTRSLPWTSWTLVGSLVVASSACNGPEEVPPPKLTDTGWFDDVTIEEPPPCDEQIIALDPDDGDRDWYWRDRPVVLVEVEAEAYSAWIVNEATGARIDPELVWNDEGTRITLEWDEWLVGDTDYTLYASDCDSTESAAFHTDPLGAPLEVTDRELEGRAFLLDLAGARWVEPAVLAGLIQLYFTTPILLGVSFLDGDQIDLVAAPGEVDPFGVVTQDSTADSWRFPIADFSDSPFVDASSPAISLVYSSYGTDVAIPVTDFVLQGTFSADGTRLGGAVLEGVGDTRAVGALIGDNRESAICDLAAGAGVDCIPCPDGPSYCLFLRAESLEGTWIPGLELVER